MAYLLTNAEARAAIGEELRTVDAAFGPPGPDNERFVEPGLKQLGLLHSAIEEALRLRTGSMTLRRVVQPFKFSAFDGRDYSLRQGDTLCLYPYLSHRDPEIFAEPEQYKFDRFYSAGQPRVFSKNGKRLTPPLMLFGGGVSMCPGRYMAMAEIKLLVALLLHRCELEVLDAHIPAPDLRRAGLGVLTPLGDMPIRYRLRQPLTS